MSSRLASLVILLAVPFVLRGCPGSGPAPQTVIFPDANLELAVRGAVPPPPYPRPFELSDLLILRVLDARNMGVRDLEGLQFALNLTALDVSNEGSGDTGITDISALARLRNLEFLDLTYNNITNISALAGLLNLGVLALEGNDVFDIEPLVVNSQSGGLGEGDSVRLSLAPLQGENGELLPLVATQIAQLRSLGVQVLLVSTL